VRIGAQRPKSSPLHGIHAVAALVLLHIVLLSIFNTENLIDIFSTKKAARGEAFRPFCLHTPIVSSA